MDAVSISMATQQKSSTATAPRGERGQEKLCCHGGHKSSSTREESRFPPQDGVTHLHLRVLWGPQMQVLGVGSLTLSQCQRAVGNCDAES